MKEASEVDLVSKQSWELSQLSPHEQSESTESTTTRRTRWSELLVSVSGPRDRGGGLLLCASRSKQLHRCCRRAVLQVLETSHLFELYAHDLVKALSTVGSVAVGMPPIHTATVPTTASSTLSTNDTSGTDIINGVNPPTTIALQQLTTASVAYYLGIVKHIKTVAADPLERFLSTYDDVIRLASERHVISRRRADEARQKAMTAQSVYTSVHEEVHIALVDWYKEHGDSHDAPPFSDKLTSKISQLKSCEARYKRLVLEENESARQCQRLEHMAIESLLMLEEDRCVIFMYGWNKILLAASSCSRRTSGSVVSSETMSMTKEPLDSLVEALCGDKKSPKRVGRRKHSLSGIIIDEEECTGAMDAETLDLPMEIGQLRDQVQRVAMDRLQTVHATRVLVSFIEAVAIASTRFAQGLQQQKVNSLDSIRDALKSVEFDPVVTLWSALITSLALHVNAPNHLANELLKLLSNPSLEHIFSHGEKVLKPYTERDTATWKQLCDAARSQARAEARYREATAHKAKARERCRSVDSVGASSSASLVNVAGKHMTQSIASIMSILPNGGEHAMKVLDPSMRVSVAHTNLEEADHKETKERQFLDSAMELTSLSLEAYKSSAETLLRHCEDTLDGYSALLASLTELWRDFQSDQQQEHSKEHSAVSSEGIDNYLNGWLKQVRDSLKSDDDATGTESARTEPFLSVLLEDSDVMQKALRSVHIHSETVVDASDRICDDDTDVDLMDDATENSATTPLRERAASASSVAVPSKLSMDESATSWLLRSLTDTESIFGKLAMTKKTPRGNLQGVGLVDTQSNVFVRYFWPEELELKTPIHILDSFACSFRDGSQRFPFQYGRVFMTNEQLMFVAWTRKQLTLPWNSIVEVTPVQNRLSDQSELVVKCHKKGSAEESYMILSGFHDRPKVLTLIGKLREQKRQIVEAPTSAPTDNATPTQTVSRQPITSPEVTIAKMTAVVSGRLPAISILNYYDTIWSERNDETMKPFYKPWLEKECFDVKVGPWQNGDFVGAWCGESYTQKREIAFKIKRKTHLYIGPPIANVMQTHFCRLEGNDRCVIQIRVEIDGIPYGDTFAVEIRWAASRDGENDVQIDVGVEVDFKKSTFLKGKIRAGTIEETTLVHKDLFASIQTKCGTERGIDPLPPIVVEPIAKTDMEYTAKRMQTFDWIKGAAVGCGVLILLALLRRFFSTRVERTCPVIDESYSGTTAHELHDLGAKMERLETEVRLMRDALHDILSFVRPNYDDT